MSRTVQIAFDCADPHRLCAFWAAVMGYRVERDEAFVRKMLDEGIATQEDVVEFEGQLVWREGDACADPDGVGPRLYFQLVPEPKAVKNRVHLDVRVGDEGRAAEIERLTALGATPLWDGQQGPHSWVTMADPEGNEFCVS
jgi:hypothetical protein